MMTVVKQHINAIYMYLYLCYYKQRIRHDRRFMLKELHKILQQRVRK